MKRAALERQRAVRTWRQHAALNSPLHSGHHYLHPGHFRKGLRVGGCGNSGCRLCHPGKIDGNPTLREWRHNFTYREQVLKSAALERAVKGCGWRAVRVQKDFTLAARGIDLARPAQRGR